ncbi:MAG: family 20 glycosylhydrolase [Bacteroidales bacterium]|nr:family 20 glycosylhydrolase [Bacteroidales bacterium]
MCQSSSFKIALASLFCLLVIFCGRAQHVGVIPAPQHVEFLSGTCTISENTPVEKQLVGKLPIDTNMDQGYILEILPDRIMMSATTETGLYYAELSLRQICDHYQNMVPSMRITDYPALQYRGWMDDISRGPVPTMEFLKREIATLAQYKMNFFNLYTEHLFKLDDYPDIAPGDGLTPAQIKELEEYAAQFHIEFFGNQQCLAHAEKTLRIPFYQDMADTKANVDPGADATRTFLQYQLETVAKAYKSPFFNINCDETEALGNGKARQYVESHGGASQVYVDHVRWVYDILRKQGKRVMMWGDIAAKDPEIVRQLPKDMLMIVWMYAPSDSYADMMRPFVKAGFEFMVAPGMSMWGTVCPSYDTYTKNIANLVRDGHQHGALGMMNTAWDDSGESLFNTTWHGMAWAAEMAWRPLKETLPAKADMERSARLADFNKRFGDEFFTREYFVDLMRLYEQTDIPLFFQNNSTYESIWDFYASKVSREYYDKNAELLRESERLYHKIPFANQNASNTNTMLHFVPYVYERQRFVMMRNMFRYDLYRYLEGDDGVSVPALLNQRDKLLKQLHLVKKSYLPLWDEECRQYSRDIVEARFDRAAQELLDIDNHVLVSSKLNDRGEAVVTLRTLSGSQDIYYTLDGRTPQFGENLYAGPFALSHSANVRAMTRNAMGEDVVSEKYVLLHKGLGKISKLNTQYATYRPQYEASGLQGLADGTVGGETYGDGTWQGYWGTDIDVEFDFGTTLHLDHFKTRFFQHIHDWIMAPTTVELYVSKNGHDYVLFRTLSVPNVDHHATAGGIYTLQVDDLGLDARYVRVVVKNAGPLPAWHQAPGQPSYLFCDEMIWQ